MTDTRSPHASLKTDFWLIVCVSAVLLYYFIRFVPFAMDEFCPHQALMVRYCPLNMLNEWREAATMYDLAPIPGHYLPLRSFYYVGSFGCILYYPLFVLWKSPHSHRLLGILLLAAQSFALHKLFKIRWFYCFMALVLFFPYMFMALFDELTAFQILSVYLTCLFTKKWLENPDAPGARQYPFWAGVFVFCSLWTKLLFFTVLPGLFGLVVYYFYERRAKINYKLASVRRKVIDFFSVGLLSAGIPTYILLQSKDRNGYAYFHAMASGWLKMDAIKAPPSPKWHLIAKPELYRYFLDPLLSTHLIFEAFDRKPGVMWFPTLPGILLTGSIVAFLAYGIWKMRSERRDFTFILVSLGLGFITYAAIALIEYSERMHHLILVYPFFLMPMFHIWSKFRRSRFLTTLLTVVATVGAITFYDATQLKTLPANHPGALKLSKVVNERFSKDYVIVCCGYGIYYTQALFGSRDQCVLYIEPFNEPELARLKELMRQLDRKALFFGRTYLRVDFLRQNFQNITELKTDFDTGEWRVWYEA